MTHHTDVMIDLETLGTAPGSVITQIGLCAFSPRDENPTVKSTRIRIDPQSALDIGLKVSWATISWWLVQDYQARQVMASGEGALNIAVALVAASNWIKENADERVNVWGNGSSFDITLLEVAYNKCGLPLPWHYRNIRDQRTLTYLGPVMDLEHARPLVAHDAEEDAIAQAMTVRMCIREIEGLGKGRP